MAEVTLHVYDVTNSGSVRANSAILGLNRFMRGGIGIGGIFHGAVEVSELAYQLDDFRLNSMLCRFLNCNWCMDLWKKYYSVYFLHRFLKD